MNGEELERGLREHPGDAQRWQVYADWLTEQGDPRGEIVVMQRQLGAMAADTPEREALEDRYAARCRAVRWPAGGPWPPMDYRARFRSLIRELQAHPDITVSQAALGDPTPPEEIARWREIAGAAWPDGMSELYAQMSKFDLEFRVNNAEGVGGGIHLPRLSGLWDYQALQDELWFDFLDSDDPFHEIRPIDRFVSEAYAVLSPVPPDGSATEQARVSYHYCGETLSSTGLSYRSWLELLLRSRGTRYWLKLTLQRFDPTQLHTWVEEGVAHVARLFPDFDPTSMYT